MYLKSLFNKKRQALLAGWIQCLKCLGSFSRLDACFQPL